MCRTPNLTEWVQLWSDTAATSDSDGVPCVEPKLSSTKVRQTLSSLTLLPHQTKTAVPNWFRRRSFAVLNSSVRFGTWVERHLNWAWINLYRNDRQPLDAVSQLFSVSHFCLYSQVLVDNRHGLDQRQSFGCVHYSPWFSLYSDKAGRTHGDLNRGLFSPHRPRFFPSAPSKNNFSVSASKSILTTL